MRSGLGNVPRQGHFSVESLDCYVLRLVRIVFSNPRYDFAGLSCPYRVGGDYAVFAFSGCRLVVAVVAFFSRLLVFHFGNHVAVTIDAHIHTAGENRAERVDLRVFPTEFGIEHAFLSRCDGEICHCSRRAFLYSRERYVESGDVASCLESAYFHRCRRVDVDGGKECVFCVGSCPIQSVVSMVEFHRLKEPRHVSGVAHQCQRAGLRVYFIKAAARAHSVHLAVVGAGYRHDVGHCVERAHLGHRAVLERELVEGRLEHAGVLCGIQLPGGVVVGKIAYGLAAGAVELAHRLPLACLQVERGYFLGESRSRHKIHPAHVRIVGVFNPDAGIYHVLPVVVREQCVDFRLWYLEARHAHILGYVGVVKQESIGRLVGNRRHGALYGRRLLPVF